MEAKRKTSKYYGAHFAILVSFETYVSVNAQWQLWQCVYSWAFPESCAANGS